MARITRDKPNKTSSDTGPILVEEPQKTETADEIDDSEEEEPEQPAPVDARLIPRAGELPGPEFFAFAKQHPAPGFVDLYVHRLKPAVVNIPPPEWPTGKKFPTYCEKVKGLITEQTNRVFDYDWLRMVRGSGKYHLRLVDRRLKRTQNRLICECFLELNEWDEHPPVLNDWRELVPCEENKWIADKLLRAKIIKRTPEGGFVAYEEGSHTNGTAPTDPSAMLAQTVNLAKDLARTMQPKESPSAFSGKDIVDLIKSNAAQNDPQKVIDAAKGLVEISRPPAAPPPPPPDNTMLTFLLERLAASEERAAKLMDRMIDKANTPPPPAPAAPDPEVQLTKTIDLFTKLKELTGGEGGTAASKMTGWQEFLKEPVTEFINLLKPFAQVGASVLLARAAQAPQSTAAAAPRPAPRPTADQIGAAASMPAEPPAQTAAAPAPDATAQPPAEQQPPAMDPNVQGVMVVISAVLQQIDLTLRDHFEHAAAGEEGYSGEDFAMWFCDNRIAVPPPYNMLAPNGLSGSEALARIRKFSANDPQGNFVPAPDAGRQVILAAYRQNQVTWQSICPTEERAKQFETFIAEFLSYDPEAPEPAAPPAKGKRA